MRFVVALIALLASDAAMAQQHQTFRDANGRTLGRSTTDARGNTTYYDSMGRNTGRSVTDSNGNTTFYDEMGRDYRQVRDQLQRQHHLLRQHGSSDRDHPRGQVIAGACWVFGNPHRAD